MAYVTAEGRNNAGKYAAAVSAVEHYRKQQQQPTPPVSLEMDGRPVPVFCVNLARRPERWAAMQLRLAASLTPEDAARVERVDAVDGAALSNEQLRHCLTRRACPPPTVFFLPTRARRRWPSVERISSWRVSCTHSTIHYPCESGVCGLQSMPIFLLGDVNLGQLHDTAAAL